MQNVKQLKKNPPTHPKRQFDVLRDKLGMDVAPYRALKSTFVRQFTLPFEKCCLIHWGFSCSLFFAHI